MNNRDDFLKHLAENEDDTALRLVFADWLDERGEHEEASRQRQWPAAKAWLVHFCEVNNPSPEKYADEDDSEDEESFDEDDYYLIDYDELLELGREAVAGAGSHGELEIACGNNMDICYALGDNAADFWRNWSIVTGIPLPPDPEQRSNFSCAC